MTLTKPYYQIMIASIVCNIIIGICFASYFTPKNAFLYHYGDFILFLVGCSIFAANAYFCLKWMEEIESRTVKILAFMFVLFPLQEIVSGIIGMF